MLSCQPLGACDIPCISGHVTSNLWRAGSYTITLGQGMFLVLCDLQPDTELKLAIDWPSLISQSLSVPTNVGLWAFKLAHYEALMIGTSWWAPERAEGAVSASAAFGDIRLPKHNQPLLQLFLLKMAVKPEPITLPTFIGPMTSPCIWRRPMLKEGWMAAKKAPMVVIQQKFYLPFPTFTQGVFLRSPAGQWVSGGGGEHRRQAWWGMLSIS